MSDVPDFPPDALLARPDIAQQIEASRAGGPTRTGRPQRRGHMDAVRAGSDEGRERYADLLARLGDTTEGSRP